MRFERIGGYDVTALIGEGSMGQVYQATDTKLNRQVALKILPERLPAIRRHRPRLSAAKRLLSFMGLAVAMVGLAPTGLYRLYWSRQTCTCAF